MVRSRIFLRIYLVSLFAVLAASASLSRAQMVGGTIVGSVVGSIECPSRTGESCYSE